MTLKLNAQIESEQKMRINFIVTLHIPHARGKKFINPRDLYHEYALFIPQPRLFLHLLELKTKTIRNLFITCFLNKMLDGSKRAHLTYWSNSYFGKTYYTNFHQTSQIISPTYKICAIWLVEEYNIDRVVLSVSILYSLT